ncbi:MAG: sensor histidine kinase [Pseudomonadales bacterium]
MASANTIGVVLLYAFLHALAVGMGQAFPSSQGAISAVWPAAGLLAFVLLITPYLQWPRWLLAALAGQLVADAVLGTADAWSSFTLAVANTVEAGVVAAIIRHLIAVPLKKARRLPLLAGGILAALIGPATGGVLGAAEFSRLDPSTDFQQNLQLWWAAHFLGVLFITPVLLGWMLESGRKLPRPLEAVILLVTLAIVTQIAFGTMLPAKLVFPGLVSGVVLPAELLFPRGPGTAQPLLILPFFLWCALRFDTRVVTVASLLVLALLFPHANLGFGPFALPGSSSPQSVLGLQIFLALLALSSLSLTIVLDARRLADATLTRRGKLEDIISRMSTDLINAGPVNIDAQIEAALGEIGRFAAADSCGLVEFDNRQQTLTLIHQWYRSGGQKRAYLQPTRPFADFPWMIAELKQRRQITIRNVNDLPLAATGLRAMMTHSEMQSLVYVPLVADNKVIGIAGFEWLRQPKQSIADLAALLHIVGQVFIDSLQRRRTLRELLVHQRKLSALTSALSLADERARRRTAVELHEDIGQSLDIVGNKLGQLANLKPENRKPMVAEMQAIIDASISATRNIIAYLSPPILYELGLAPAIKWLADRFHKHEGIVCNVTEHEPLPTLDEEINMVLFQAVRELLTNVSKHAGAAKVNIDLRFVKGEIDISMQDNGEGFDSDDVMANPGQGGFGLFSLNERITNIGGSFVIESAASIGTKARIVYRAPYSEATWAR